METLSSSVFNSKITDEIIHPISQVLSKSLNKKFGSLKINQSLNLSSLLWTSERVRISGSSRIFAISTNIVGENLGSFSVAEVYTVVAESCFTVLNLFIIALSGFRRIYLLWLCCDGLFHMTKANSSQSQFPVSTFGDTSEVGTSITGYGTGTRTGLYRTPISGGVQNATSAHGLPKPALAVRNLMEQVRFAHLCTVMSCMHHRREGYPFGSLVDFSPDSTGHPIFSFSPLAIHTRNLLGDPRCTLVVQIPGWTGLSNARVTIFGDVFPLSEDQQEWAHKQYLRKHQQGPSQHKVKWFWVTTDKRDIHFIGGFGTVAWVDVKEYENLSPDKIAMEGGDVSKQNKFYWHDDVNQELNAIFSKPLRELLSTEIEVDDAALISIDSRGTDVRVRQGAQFNIQRISFEEGRVVETLEEAKVALHQLVSRGQFCDLQK
ncbi:hypothetical protein RND81_05G237800 [Saponaria officinalis]|uniref:CREG-like beta-barrel domain-containing protein n=1 Tax=Saponaria officinalis TaxID=3572 RepID=A0AAW1L1C9_SAPOF